MQKHPIIRPAFGTGLILLIPLVMTILDRHKAEGDGWRWSPMDFGVMGSLLFGSGLAYELVARRMHKKNHRTVLGVAIFFLVLLVWIELAVGAVSQLLELALG